MNCDFEIRGDHFVCRRCGQKLPRVGAAPRAFAECRLSPARPAPPRRTATCAHLGGELRREQCETCRGHVLKKIFACAKHGETDHDRCRACRDYEPRPSEAALNSDKPCRLLVKFVAGLGDHVQFTVVLRHLARLRPRWTIDVSCQPGTAEMLRPFCRRAFSGSVPDESAYDVVLHDPWCEPDRSYPWCAATKAEKCLIDRFSITPRPEWCDYSFACPPAEQARVDTWLAARKLTACALIQHLGRSWKSQKNVPCGPTRSVCRRLLARGITPLVLDLDRPTKKVRDNLCAGIVHPPAGDELWQGLPWADATTIAALAKRAALCLGIDSGPTKIMAGSGTPTLTVWPHAGALHPLHYAAPHASELHVLREGHATAIREPRGDGLEYFERHYRSVVVRTLRDLPAIAEEMLRCS